MATDSTSTRKVIDLATIPQRDRQEVWRVISAPNFEMANLPDQMSAHGVAYYLGPVLLTRSRHPRQTLIRTADRVRSDGADDIFCSVELEGAAQATIEDSVVRIDPGGVSLWDLSRPSAKFSQAGETLCMRINRDAWRGAAGDDPLVHGLTLGSMGRMFRDHMLSLENTMSSNPALASAELGHATLQLLAACIRPELDVELMRAVQSEVLPFLFRKAERYIKARMEDPSLSPDAIASAIGVSRSRLYSMFDQTGGVASFIRRMRLEAAHATLSAPQGMRMGEVAFAVGFNSQSQFNRAFKRYFGYTPGDAREHFTNLDGQ